MQLRSGYARAALVCLVVGALPAVSVYAFGYWLILDFSWALVWAVVMFVLLGTAGLAIAMGAVCCVVGSFLGPGVERRLESLAMSAVYSVVLSGAWWWMHR